MFEAWLTRFAASNRLRESNNFKADSVRVRERKFISAVIHELVLLPRHVIQTPTAEPITRGIARGKRGAVGKFDIADLRLSLPNSRTT